MVFKKNVILSEDDDDDQQFFKEALGDISVPVSLEIVSHGQALMDRLYSGIMPDIVFLDINMPYKNGLECLKEIRRDELLRDIPVVILSTTVEKRAIHFSYDHGASMYIGKPVTLKRLSEMIEIALRHDWEMAPFSLHNFFYS
jgi:CheY-like chemotaxis protein